MNAKRGGQQGQGQEPAKSFYLGVTVTLLALLGVLIWQLPRIHEYEFGDVAKFLVYLVAALLPTAVALGLLNGYARLTSKRFGVVVQLGGPAALFVVVLVIGLYYETHARGIAPILLDQRSSPTEKTTADVAALLERKLNSTPKGSPVPGPSSPDDGQPPPRSEVSTDERPPTGPGETSAPSPRTISGTLDVLSDARLRPAIYHLAKNRTKALVNYVKNELDRSGRPPEPFAVLCAATTLSWMLRVSDSRRDQKVCFYADLSLGSVGKISDDTQRLRYRSVIVEVWETAAMVFQDQEFAGVFASLIAPTPGG